MSIGRNSDVAEKPRNNACYLEMLLFTKTEKRLPSDGSVGIRIETLCV